MRYPEKLLGDGERLVFELRTHPKALVVPALVLLATTGAASYVAATIPDGGAQAPLRLMIVAVAVGVAGRWAVWPFLTWYSTTYILTTWRLVLREGVLVREGHDIPLWRITDVSVHRGLLERLLGCGTLTVETAGEGGPMMIRSLPHVTTAHRELYGRVDAAPVRRAPESASVDGP